MLSSALRDLMLPKIPQLKRENASLRDPRLEDAPSTVQEAGTNQKIPQTHTTFVSAKKVWWDDQQKDPQHDVQEEEGHDATIRTDKR